MAFFSFFRRRPSNAALPARLGALLVQVAVHESQQLQSLWGRTLSERDQVALFAEYAILLLNVADRLASQSLDDRRRVSMMRAALEVIEDAFSKQGAIEATRDEARQYFQMIFVERSEQYAAHTSIMGGRESLVTVAALSIAKQLAEVGEQELPATFLETGKSISTCVGALLQTDAFQGLLTPTP